MDPGKSWFDSPWPWLMFLAKWASSNLPECAPPWLTLTLIIDQCFAMDPGADPGIYFGGGGLTKVSNRKLRAKPESRARSARVSRAKPESRARSARELRAKPEPRAKPEKKRGEGSGEGAR